MKRTILEAFDFNEVETSVSLIDDNTLINLYKKAVEKNYPDIWKLINKVKDNLIFREINDIVYVILDNNIESYINVKTLRFRNVQALYNLSDIFEYNYKGYLENRQLPNNYITFLLDIICKQILNIAPILACLYSFSCYTNNQGITFYNIGFGNEYLHERIQIFAFDRSILHTKVSFNKDNVKAMTPYEFICQLLKLKDNLVNNLQDGCIVNRNKNWIYDEITHTYKLDQITNISISKNYIFNLVDIYSAFSEICFDKSAVDNFYAILISNIIDYTRGELITIKNSKAKLEIIPSAFKWIKATLTNFKVVSSTNAYTKPNNLIILIISHYQSPNMYLLCDVEIETTVTLYKRYLKYLNALKS